MAPATAHSPAPFGFSPSQRGGFDIHDANDEVIGWARREPDARLFATSAELLAGLKAYRDANHGTAAVITKAEGRSNG
jgi:hypothetical protein